MKAGMGYKDSELGAVENEAIAWLAERDEGFGPGREAAFENWCRTDPRHAVMVAELEQVLRQLDVLALRREEVNAHFFRVSSSSVVGKTKEGLLLWWRPVAWIGMVAALVVGGFFGFLALRSMDRTEIRYVTTTAGYESARLSDGSLLELNQESAVRVCFTATERSVELESGEAHFEVAYDGMRPFLVKAGGVSVRAVGTAFNVRFRPGRVEVMVTEGKVTVVPLSAKQFYFAEAPPVPLAGRVGDLGKATPLACRLLSAQERMTVFLGPSPREAVVAVHTIDYLAPSEMRSALAWQRRVADFSDTPLAEVAARFNWHNSLQLTIVDPGLGARRIGGVFALNDVEAFVRLLERDGIVRVERKGDVVRLLTP